MSNLPGTVQLSPEQFERLLAHIRAAQLGGPVLLTAEQAAARWGIGERRFHELRSEPWMPRPVLLGVVSKRWSLAELDAAVANLPRETSPEGEPFKLLRGRVQKLKAGAKAA